jgi:predicted GNAT family N-acyltransferase
MQAGAATDLVHAAFVADPILRWVFADDERWAGIGRVFVDRLIEVRLSGGEAWVLEHPPGQAASVALFDPPGGVYASREGLWAEFNAHLTDDEATRLEAYDTLADAAQPAEPHWYLGVLAVTPTLQGRGYARRVVTPILDSANRTQTPVTLETATPINLAIYARFGFEVRTEFDLPGGGPHVWLLERVPRLMT